jgi:acyl dehydratase
VIEAGARLGPSRWVEIDQGRIDTFADATEDRQGIHIDPAAAAAGPFGTTVAHGFLTLSLVVPLLYEVAPPNGVVLVNYGVDRVRFPAAVPAGTRIRALFDVDAVDDVPGGRQATITATVEREGGDKPVCVAQLLLRILEPTGGDT